MTENKLENPIYKEAAANPSHNDDEAIDYFAILIAFGEQKITIIFVTFLAIFIGLFVCYSSPQIYIAKTTFIPSNNTSNTGSNLLNGLNGMNSMNSLNSLVGLVGVINNGASKANEAMLINYIRSRRFQSDMVNSLKLTERFKVKNLNEAISVLDSSFAITIEKQSGLMVIAVENRDPELAAFLANELVLSLRNYLRKLDIENVNEKNSFYAKQILTIRQKLPQLENDYKNAEKKAGIRAANYYAIQGGLPNQIIDKELQIQMLMNFVTIDNPEIKKMNKDLNVLKEQLRNQQLINIPNFNLEKTNDLSNSSEYFGLKSNEKSELIFQALQLYSSFKIQEAILQGLNQQLEIGSFEDLKKSLSPIQIIDKAEVPLNSAKPNKAKIMLIFSSIGFFTALLIAFFKHKISILRNQPQNFAKLKELKNVWRF